MKKTMYFILLLVIIDCFGDESYSLTKIEMLTGSVNPLITSEMGNIRTTFDSINDNFQSKISPQIVKKNAFTRRILNNRVIGETLLKEIKLLNKDINSIIYLKQKVSNDLPIK